MKRNDDYPQSDEAVDPDEFPRFQPDQCIRITARVYNPLDNSTTTVNNVLVKTTAPVSCINGSLSLSSSDDCSNNEGMTEWRGQNDAGEERAYWLQRTIRQAIYGKVRQGIVLNRRSLNGEVIWEITNKLCAVKEMSWNYIERHRGSLAEDPIKEVSAMQYLKENDASRSAESIMSSEHVIMPLDLLSDERYLYSVMPYCDGGELFDRLEQHEKFTEPEARYWFRQILCGIDFLHRNGICHRDISLENLLVHENSSLIIDLGMCLRLPSNRRLISPQGTCGKWHYMSPEIALNRVFDGYAVDLWSAGVILFLMLTGIPPWERPLLADERFRYMTAGYLAPILSEWAQQSPNLEVSPEAMDLLQKMLWFQPKERLSLRQVRAHPWILQEDVSIPIASVSSQQQPWA